MITTTMTADEITRVFRGDMTRLNAFWHSKEKILSRQLRHDMRRNPIYCKTYDVSTRNADYKCICVVGRGLKASSYMMYVKESNEYIPLTDTTCRTSEILIAVNIHTFRRISERYYHDEAFDLDRTMARYYSHPIMFAQVYIDESETHVVFAATGGIFLGTYESKKHIVHIKTFVSTDMLKVSQKEAVKKICFMLDAFPSQQPGALKDADVIARRNIDIFNKIDFSEIWKIYGEYFKGTSITMKQKNL